MVDLIYFFGEETVAILPHWYAMAVLPLLWEEGYIGAMQRKGVPYDQARREA